MEATGVTSQLPLRGGSYTYFKIEGRPFKNPQQQVTALNPEIGHDYLRAQGIPLLQGRTFTEQETKQTPQTVTINEAFAPTYIPGEDPLGKHLIIDEGQPLTCEIIGVTRNVKQISLPGEFIPTMYLPSLEIGRATLVIRTSSDPLALAAAAPYGDITQQNPMAQRAGACAGDAGRFGAELEPIALQCDARMVRGARRNTMI